MRAQTETALIDCDAILFVIDARAGITPTDRHFAAAVRRVGKPIILVANKAEGRPGATAPMRPSAWASAIRSPFSAEHGEGLSELYDALLAALPPAARLDEDEDDEPAPLVLGEEEDGSESIRQNRCASRCWGGRTLASRRSSTASSARTGCSRGRSPASPATALASRRSGADGSSSSSTRRASDGARASSRRSRSSRSPTRCAQCALQKSWCFCSTLRSRSKNRT